MSGRSALDPFEIVDDPTELISHRNATNASTDGANGSSHPTGDPSMAPIALPSGHSANQSPASQFNAASSGARKSSQRQLPPGFAGASSLASASHRSIDHQTNDRHPARTYISSSPSSAGSLAQSRVWNPPPRPWMEGMKSKAAAAVAALQPQRHGDYAAVPMVGGSGARVPNQFLNEHGEFSAGSSRSHDTMPAIDLTADDASDDEPELVHVKNGDIVADEQKNLGPVCLGFVQGVILCLNGCPEPIAAVDNPGTLDPNNDRDEAWSKDNWPEASHWLTRPGYRPVLIRRSATASTSGQTPSGDWRLGGRSPAMAPPTRAEMTVAPLLSPMAHYREQEAHGIPPAQRRAGAHVKPPFGNLSERFVSALEPLFTQQYVKFESRCRLVDKGRSANFIHPVQTLVFCNRPRATYVAERLAQAGINLEQPPPGHYNEADYDGHPALIQPAGHGPANTPAAAQDRFGSQMFFGGVGGSRLVQSKEMTEEERRKQIETVYDQLVAGEDLEQTEPAASITTRLFAHQKQGLTFLLDREKQRSFDEAGEAGSSKSRSLDIDAAGAALKDSVGLWKVVRNRTDGSIRTYRNIITQHEQDSPPVICRGALLADDMGLGKTITVIATIASTMGEARAFAREPLAVKGLEDADEHMPAVSSEDDEDGSLGDMAAGLQGASGSGRKRKPAGRPPQWKQDASKKRKGSTGKRAARQQGVEEARRNNIAVKSRATLIVAPLTIVSNWEEQLREHWRKSRPRIYIYHGASRSDNPREIANHDVVLTTYATLAWEFSNQSTWVDGADAANKKDASSDIEGSEANGQPAGPGAKKQKTAKAKGTKRKGAGKEAVNPLQRIEWFRVVLDEAHAIKEVRTIQCRAVCNLSAQRRLSLTGTPVQNRLDDLYAQIKFLRLEPFSDRAIWNEQCGQRQKRSSLTARSNANPSNEPIEQVALVKIQTIMKFLTLRRTKETRKASGAKLLELPKKNTRVVTIDFDERERVKYMDLHARYKEDFDEMEAQGSVGHNYATILQEISNLRICCDDPNLVDTSKDARREREGGASGSRISDAISEDGLTRERAAALFEIFSNNAGAECGECQLSLDSHADGGNADYGREELTDDPTTSKSKPVVTRCCHIFCSSCFSKAVPKFKQPKKLTREDTAECPQCAGPLKLIVDVIQLEAADLEETSYSSIGGSAVNSARTSPTLAAEANFDWGSDEEAKDAGDAVGPTKARAITAKQALPPSRSAKGFGCDRDIPVDERTGLSHKTRFLLADLTPFSQCNPKSLLYDPTAPRLVHYEPSEAERSSASHMESVVTMSVQGNGGDYQPIKSIVFSQWTSMLDRVEKALYRAGIRSVRLDGKMRRADRAASLESFKRDSGVEVFLISLRAGGFGLNLVSACRAYCIEPAWNPAQEQQAMDRVHRLGQVRPVITTKLVTKDSIEERMLQIQKRKEQLASKVSEKRSSGAPTRAEEKEQRREEIRTLMG